MTHDEKIAIIDRFEAAFAPIEALISDLSEAALRYVPELEGAWSINDHLVHLLDAESAVYFRLRLAIAEPGSAVQLWDEEAWHSKLGYGNADGRACLAAAKAMRAALCASLRAIVDTDWSGYFLLHPERGRLELENFLVMYRDHLAYHAPFIKRDRDAWKAANN